MHYKAGTRLRAVHARGTSVFNGRKLAANVYLSMFFLAQSFKNDTQLAFLEHCSFRKLRIPPQISTFFRDYPNV